MLVIFLNSIRWNYNVSRFVLIYLSWYHFYRTNVVTWKGIFKSYFFFGDWEFCYWNHKFENTKHAGQPTGLIFYKYSKIKTEINWSKPTNRKKRIHSSYHFLTPIQWCLLNRKKKSKLFNILIRLPKVWDLCRMLMLEKRNPFFFPYRPQKNINSIRLYYFWCLIQHFIIQMGLCFIYLLFTFYEYLMSLYTMYSFFF